MAKSDLGTKRICPVTGKKFYDLGKDPIVSPYTGQSYPRTYFEPLPKATKPEPEEEVEEPVADTAAPELVPLEEAEPAEAAATGDEDIEIEDDEDDTFLEQDEDEDEGDVSGLIDGEIEEEDEG